MNVRPAGREPCACSSPINQILERLDQMDADIASAQQAANTAVGTANSQAGVAAASAASAAQDASDALGHAAAAQQSADDALLEATNAAGSAQDAADDLADALLAIQNIEATIASVLASDIGAKVDKLTTAGFHLYSHTGSTQGEVAPDINPTAATIPIRDSAGKLFGADPANGATDKTLTTANWISQTGNSAPNNLVHRSGDETVDGEKKMCNINNNRVSVQTSSGDAGWRKVYEWSGGGSFLVYIHGNNGTRRNGSAILASVAVGSPGIIGDGSSWNELAKIVLGSSTTKQVALAYDPVSQMTKFYYYFPNSEVTTIELLGTAGTTNKKIVTTITIEDPNSFTAHVIV